MNKLRMAGPYDHSLKRLVAQRENHSRYMAENDKVGSILRRPCRPREEAFIRITVVAGISGVPAACSRSLIFALVARIPATEFFNRKTVIDG